MRRIKALKSFVLFNSDFNISASLLWVSFVEFAFIEQLKLSRPRELRLMLV